MKNICALIICFLCCLFYISCDSSNGDTTASDNTENDDIINSISNFDQQSDTLEQPKVGPEKISVVAPSAGGTHMDWECNFYDGQTDAEVNKPITITFDGDIDEETVTSLTFYLKDDAARVQYARIVVRENCITLIPQLRLQPDHNYTLIMAGVKDADGNNLESIVINFKNRDLDFGLYFFGKYGLCEKYYPGVQNEFYDPAKQTLIYCHGWQQQAVIQTDWYGREGYNHEIFFWKEEHFKGVDPSGRNDPKLFNGLKVFTNHAWIDKGWNTAFVYWTQFAGSSETFLDITSEGIYAPQGRIWSFDGPGKSNYHVLEVKIDSNGNRICKGVFREWDKKVEFNGETITVKSVSELLGLYVVDALKQNTSGNIRIVGHSLGSQLACNLAYQCFKNGILLDRIALLEPAMGAAPLDRQLIGQGETYLPDSDSKFDKDDRTDWVGERMRYYLFEMKEAYNNNLAIEIYHTTPLNLPLGVIDDNVPLTSAVCDVNFAPWYYGAAEFDQLAEKHVNVRHSYMLSFASEPPVECTISWFIRTKTGLMGPSAATPAWRILEMMNSNYEWTQVEGRYTPDTADDWFERKLKASGMGGSIPSI